MPEFLIHEFSRAGLEPSCLIFEITESDFISDLPNAIERLRELLPETAELPVSQAAGADSRSQGEHRPPRSIIAFDVLGADSAGNVGSAG